MKMTKNGKQMTRFAIFLIVLASSAIGLAQTTGNQKGLVSLIPIYQSWSVDGGDDFSEFSLPLFLYYPVNRNFSLTLRGSSASASGDNMESISGVTDTQLGLSYYLENAKVVFNVGLNLPTGKKKLSLPEFRTSSLIGNNIFNMRVPNFGQGLNVSAGFTWALPVSETLVVGLGASYQYKSGFKPLDGFVEDYDPGEEILLTGGFDARLGQTTTLSSDVTFTVFGTDKIGRDDVFSAGNKLLVSLQFRNYFGFNELWFFARYRTRAKNEQALVLGQVLTPETAKTFPNQFEIMGHYRVRISRGVHARFLAEGRFYEQTAAVFSGVSLFGAGFAPEFTLSPKVRLPITFKYFFGRVKDGPNIAGVELGLGLSLSF